MEAEGPEVLEKWRRMQQGRVMLANSDPWALASQENSRVGRRPTHTDTLSGAPMNGQDSSEKPLLG